MKKAGRKPSTVFDKIGRWILYVLLAFLAALGVYAVVLGMTPHEVTETPMPTQSYSISPQSAATAPKDTQDGFDVGDMAPSSVWIPALKSYAVLDSESQFVTSRYGAELQTLTMPTEAGRAAWYSDGGALWGGDEGTTLLAAHIGAESRPGVFWGIGDLPAGSTIWTKDASGRAQSWAATSVWSAQHKAFPADYFSASGERRLVVTTCGGAMNAQGYYANNIFLVATPTD